MDPRQARFDPPAQPRVQPAHPPEEPRAPAGLEDAPALTFRGPQGADAWVLGVPFDGTSGRRPMQRHGPGLLRAALAEIAGQHGAAPAVSVLEAGDVRTDPVSTDVLDEHVQGAIATLDDQAPGALGVLLGGEHTISLPAVRALEPASIVSLDAHTDLWRETNGRSIAHSTWLHHARAELGCEVALPLTRTTRGEAEDAVQADDIHLELPASLPEPVYLTIDVDVFDPDDAPAVVFPERGGPSVETVLGTIREVAQRYTLCGVDVVEVNANRLGPTTMLGAAALLTALGAHATP